MLRDVGGDPGTELPERGLVAFNLLVGRALFPIRRCESSPKK
jgi:hypothetical protein